MLLTKLRIYKRPKNEHCSSWRQVGKKEKEKKSQLKNGSEKASDHFIIKPETACRSSNTKYLAGKPLIVCKYWVNQNCFTLNLFAFKRRQYWAY